MTTALFSQLPGNPTTLPVSECSGKVCMSIQKNCVEFHASIWAWIAASPQTTWTGLFAGPTSDAPICLLTWKSAAVKLSLETAVRLLIDWQRFRQRDRLSPLPEGTWR